MLASNLFNNFDKILKNSLSSLINDHRCRKIPQDVRTGGLDGIQITARLTIESVDRAGTHLEHSLWLV